MNPLASRAPSLVIGLVVLQAACSSTGGSSAPNQCDLSVSSPRGDMSPVPDLCSGTPLAGTCIEAFFAAPAGCFAATTSCVWSALGTGEDDTVACWESGARMIRTTENEAQRVTWLQDGRTCMTSTAPLAGSGAIVYRDANDRALSLNGNGDVTCPDGSHINIGTTAIGDCAAINLFFVAPSRCSAGSCC